MQLTRCALYQDIGKTLGRPIRGRVLGVSGIDKFGLLIDPSADVLKTTYPEVDLQDLPFSAESFDAVITDQVLEHLADPRRAVQKAYRVLRPGGLAVHTTRFVNPVHPSPRDYFRFSLDGLEALCPPNAQIVRSQASGEQVGAHPASSSRSDTLHRYPREVQSSPLVGDADETKYPIVKWILMRKPGEHDDA